MRFVSHEIKSFSSATAKNFLFVYIFLLEKICFNILKLIVIKMSQANNTERGEQLKKRLFDLQAQRKKIEDELVMHKVVLETNRVGMTDSLVDEDDFPRNDIDVYAVRHARSEIIRLENDAKDLFSQMQSHLEELHSLSKPSNST